MSSNTMAIDSMKHICITKKRIGNLRVQNYYDYQTKYGMKRVIAYIGGISGGVDAYQVAFIIPEILNHIVASGFLSVTFIPIFSHYLVQNIEEEA